MQFSQGQTVVHPHHGPATVTEIADRKIGATTAQYLVLQVHRTNLDIAVPVEKADEVGLRAVYGEVELRRLFEVLQAPSDEEEQSWARRLKANQEKLRNGDPLMTAGVVRDLSRRLTARGLSAGERDMLKQARRPLLAEIVLSLGVSDEQAEQMLDGAVLDESPTGFTAADDAAMVAPAR